MNTHEQLEAWMRQYGLVISHVAPGKRCVYTLLGRPCRARQSGRRRTCPACLSRTLADHGKYFRRPGDSGPTLFVGHVYDAPTEADRVVLDDLVRLGLYCIVGAQGSGWYNDRTFPVIVSAQPIPAHHYHFRRA